MAMYALSDTTLTALGDAVRSKTQLTRMDFWATDIGRFNSPNTTDTWGTFTFIENGPLTVVQKVKAPEAIKMSVRLAWKSYSSNNYVSYYLAVGDYDSQPPIEPFSYDSLTRLIESTTEYELDESKTLTLYLWVDSANYWNSLHGVQAEIIAYDEENNVVPIYQYGKGFNTMTVAEMTDAINGFLPVPTAKDLVVTGSCNYRFANDGWNWLIEKYGNQIACQNVSNVSYMFHNSGYIRSIPFEININSTMPVNMNSMFMYCSSLHTLPIIRNANNIDNMTNMFYGCYRLREIPVDYFDEFNFEPISLETSAYGKKIGSYVFQYCYSLRQAPVEIFAYDNKTLSYSNVCYRGMFTSCYALDSVTNLPVPYTVAPYTSNLFSNTFSNLSHLRELTFQTNEDSSPIVVQWKNQVIDLSEYVGYGSSTSFFTGYNSGLLAEDQITTKEQALERVNAETGEPDTSFNAVYRFTLPQSWTTDIAYSRYNKDSARRTLESLPDASAYLATAGGTNTIKFKGDSGSCLVKISSLEETDIAAAVAKGWTVTFV